MKQTNLRMLERVWIIKNLPLLISTVALAIGLTEEQVKLQMVSGATTGCVMIALWVVLRLLAWAIGTVGVGKLAAIVTKHAVISLVSMVSMYLAWEYCTIDNILWAYYTGRTYLMKYGVIPTA